MAPSAPRARPLSPLLRLPSALALLFALAGCRGQEATPQLISVLDVGPRVAAAGDSLEIVGASFPVRKGARVTLSGAVYRPGQDPEEGVDIDLDGLSSSSSRLDVRLTDASLEPLTGKPELSAHATFRGAVQVAFPAATPGSLPITGTLEGVVLDFRPAAPRKAVVQAETEEGERVLSMLGMRVADEPAPTGGLSVIDVAAESAAEAAGIAKGDVLVSLDGWTVQTRGDVLPSGRKRYGAFGVLRAGEGQPLERQVAIQGYKPRGSTDLLAMALLLGTAAAALLFFASPAARALVWLDRWTARAASAGRGRRHVLVWLLSCLVAFWKGDAAHAGSDVLPYIVFLVASGLCSLLPFGKTALGVDPDAGTALLLPVVLALVVSLGSGQHPKKRRWSPVRSLKLAAFSLVYHLPSAGAAAAVVVLTGSFALSDVVRAQGGMPWQWFLVRTPANVLLFLLFFAPALIDRERVAGPLPDADPLSLDLAPPSAGRAGLSSALGWGGLFVLSGLGAALFLGGWALPFVDRAQAERSFLLQAAGALLFLVKTWSLALGLAVVRETFPRILLDQHGSPFLRFFLPATVLALGLTFAWVAWDPAPLLRRSIAAVVTLLLTLLSVHLARRLGAAVRAESAQPHVSPFL